MPLSQSGYECFRFATTGPAALRNHGGRTWFTKGCRCAANDRLPARSSSSRDRGGKAADNCRARGGNLMDAPTKFDARAAAWGRRYPRSGTPARKAATAALGGMPPALFAGVLALLLTSWGQAGHAQDHASGNVERVQAIGFTVADVD